MFFVKINNGNAVQIYRAKTSICEDDHEITEEQFKQVSIPCKVTVLEDGSVEFGEKVPYSEESSVPSKPVEETEEVSEPTPQDDTDAMLIDHEYRLTLLELGLTE